LRFFPRLPVHGLARRRAIFAPWKHPPHLKIQRTEVVSGMLHTGMTTLILMLMAGCNSKQSRPVIGIDEAHDITFAQSICAFHNANAANNPHIALPCLEEPLQMVSETENAFRGAFQENPACSNLVLKLYDTSSPREFAGAGDWRLTFGIAVKNGNLNLKESAWSLFSRVPDNTSGYAEGNMSNPYEAAGRVCAVVKGVGGKLQ
jgi:hypothetical protein